NSQVLVLQEDGTGPEDIPDDVGLLRLGERDHVAGLEVWVRLLFSLERVAQVQEEELGRVGVFSLRVRSGGDLLLGRALAEHGHARDLYATAVALGGPARVELKQFQETDGAAHLELSGAHHRAVDGDGLRVVLPDFNYDLRVALILRVELAELLLKLARRQSCGAHLALLLVLDGEQRDHPALVNLHRVRRELRDDVGRGDAYGEHVARADAVLAGWLRRARGVGGGRSIGRGLCRLLGVEG